MYILLQAFKNGLVGLDEEAAEPPLAKRRPSAAAASNSQRHSRNGERRKKIADDVVKVLSPYYKEKKISSKVCYSLVVNNYCLIGVITSPKLLLTPYAIDFCCPGSVQKVC